MDEQQNNLNLFLKELGELTKKYNITIDGCGCCGSPYLIDISDDSDVNYIGDNLYFDKDNNIYTVNNN